MKTSEKSLSIRQKILLISTTSISLLGILILLSIWRISDRTLEFLSKIFKFQLTQPKVEMTNTIIKQMQDIQELTTTVYKMETIIPTSKERTWGDFSIGTTKLLYIGKGEVRAGIDLSQITTDDIKINNNVVQINLPPPQILDSKVDLENSRVYDYDRGFWNLGPDAAIELQDLAQKETLSKVVKSACEDGILIDANQKAKKTIFQLLDTLVEEQIEVKTTEPLKNSCELKEKKDLKD